MDVEKAQISDIDALVKLRMEYLREDNGYLDKKDADAIIEMLPDYFKTHIGKDIFCYIMREENQIVSCAFLLVIEKPMSPAFINGKTGMVLNVYTRPSSRHKGYAKRIMRELIADAQRMGICRMDLKSTDEGYSLYQSVGFVDDISKYHLMKWNREP